MTDTSSLEAWLFESARSSGRFHVVFDGETIVDAARDPEHEACRALRDRGISGRVTFRWSSAGTAGLSMDITKGAGQTVQEGPDGRPRITRYRPFPSTVEPSARVSRSGGTDLPERQDEAA